jgi:hypothetical protein
MQGNVPVGATPPSRKSSQTTQSRLEGEAPTLIAEIIAMPRKAFHFKLHRAVSTRVSAPCWAVIYWTVRRGSRLYAGGFKIQECP